VGNRLITVPAKAHFVMVREEYLAITHGDPCAAAILNWAEQWAVFFVKTKQEPWIRGKSIADIGKALLGLYKRHEIQQALTMLRECGYIRVARSSKNAWDRKYMYSLDVERVQEAIESYFAAVDDLLVDHRQSAGGSSMVDGPTIDDQQVDHRRLAGGLSTLEDQILDQIAPTETDDQKAAAEHARERAAAADSVTDVMRESSDQLQPHPRPLSQGRGEIVKAETVGEANTTPPSSGAPPLRTALDVYGANMGKAGEVIQRGIAAAVARYGEQVVIRTIERAAAKGGRTWAYVETMLGDIPAAGAWHVGADATDALNSVKWDGKGSLLEHWQRSYEPGEVQP